MNVILNTRYVILNVVKNLSESANVRLLCYPVDASLSLSMNRGLRGDCHVGQSPPRNDAYK